MPSIPRTAAGVRFHPQCLPEKFLAARGLLKLTGLYQFLSEVCVSFSLQANEQLIRRVGRYPLHSPDSTHEVALQATGVRVGQAGLSQGRGAPPKFFFKNPEKGKGKAPFSPRAGPTGLT